ncbi:MAG: cation transporter [Clostridia bacterium]|nr:cation transporter [Clostridia bacterium]
MVEIKLEINGMMCDNCVRHVNEAIKEIPGVKSVNADRENKCATVTAKDGTDVEAIKRAVAEAGYEAGAAEVKAIEKKGLFSRLKK